MRDESSIYQNCFDHLMSIYSEGNFYDEIKSARKTFIKTWGRLDENDPGYEARLHQFFDWYVFDRPLEKLSRTPIEHFLSTAGHFESQKQEAIYRQMKKTLRSLFRIKKVKGDSVILQNLMDRKTSALSECDFNIIFEAGSIIDGRLIFLENGPILSKGLCLHPTGSSKFIRKNMKTIQKSKLAPEKKLHLLRKLMLKLAKMYNLHLIYKHVKAEKVYSNNPPMHGLQPSTNEGINE